MKFNYILVLILFACLKCSAQEIPQVAFLFEDKKINIDYSSFKKLLISDTIHSDFYEKLYSSMYNDFEEKQSFTELIKLLNPSFVDSLENTNITNGIKVIVPSYNLSMKYIKSKVKFENKYTFSSPTFDIILYPQLRDSLEKLTKNMVGCSHYDKEKVQEVRELQTSINSILKQNLPVSKTSLESLIDITAFVNGQTHRNCGADDDVNTENFTLFKNVGFEVLKKAIAGNTTDVPVIIQTVDKDGTPVKSVDVYYCPVWAPSDVQKISSLTNPIKKNLPIADYYFWSGEENRTFALCQCNATLGIKIRPQTDPIVVILTCNKK